MVTVGADAHGRTHTAAARNLQREGALGSFSV